MLDFALVDDGDGLEAAVRVLADAARAARPGANCVRAGVVEQQERAQVAAVAVVGEQRADRESVADPVRAGGAVDTEDRLHVGSIWFAGPRVAARLRWMER